MTALPPPVMAVLLFVVWGTTALRLVWTRHGVVNTRQNVFLVLASITVLMSKSWVHRPLDETFGYGTARHFGNAIIMLSFASLFSLAVAWALGHKKWPRVHVVSMAFCALLGIALLMLSAPARAAGQRLEESGGWQYAGYFVVYAIPSLTVCATVVFVATKSLRRTSVRSERRMFGVLTGIGVVSGLDAGSMAVAAVMSAMGVTNGFTEFRTAINGVTTMFILVGMCSVAVRPAIRAAMETFQLDRPSRLRRQLSPMWRTLTDSVPGVVLELRPADRGALPSRMALHRMCVEIRDSMLVVDEYPQFGRVPPLGEDRDLSVAVGLHLSCMARAAGESPQPDTSQIRSHSVDLRNEVGELARIAGHWAQAGRIAREWVAYRESVPN
ncbi:MAB_1171c family putative transporter [Rhodococcus sp. NPDC058521]|uniref:MAB_1171c family putative transporter n=1 Tax=Rhodococcus sp. NPDC058521 TaxID=3346536 RepID=UPI003667F40E